MLPGQEWGIEARIENRSKTVTHHLVKVGDGSEMGWREPTFGVTAEMQDATGAFHELTKHVLMRCGNYDSAWGRDGIALAPGQSVPVEWITPIDVVYELARSGQVRIVARYLYEGGAKRSFEQMIIIGDPDHGDRPPPPEIAALPPFELVSEPLGLRYHADETLALQVTPKRPLRAGVLTPADAVLEVSIANRTSSTVSLTGSFELHVEPLDDDWKEFPEELVVPAQIGPHATVTLHPKTDGILRTSPGPVRLRLVALLDHALAGDAGTGAVQVFSDWVTMDVR